MTRIRMAALGGAAALLAAAAPAAQAAPAAPAAWYTPAFAARVDAAGVTGVPLPAGADTGTAKSSIAFVGIRPGTRLMLAPSNIPVLAPYCTANFVFQTTAGAFDPTQQLYIGTAGHCGSVGQTIRAIAVAPGTTNPVVVTVGQIVADSGTTEDFALIQINPVLNDWVSPSVAHLGGPTGVYTGPGREAAALTGHGVAMGTGGTPRAGLLHDFDGTAFRMTVPVADGDSGAPIVTATGLAVGHVSTASGSEFGAELVGRSIQQALSVAGKPLATCASAVPWPLPGCPAV